MLTDKARKSYSGGRDEGLLKKYLWHAFFTDHYENAASTRAFSDFNALKGIVCEERKPDGNTFGLADVPIFAEHVLVEAEELRSGP